MAFGIPPSRNAVLVFFPSSAGSALFPARVLRPASSFPALVPGEADARRGRGTLDPRGPNNCRRRAARNFPRFGFIRWVDRIRFLFSGMLVRGLMEYYFSVLTKARFR